jgi:hypothetical protein
MRLRLRSASAQTLPERSRRVSLSEREQTHKEKGLVSQAFLTRHLNQSDYHLMASFLAL